MTRRELAQDRVEKWGRLQRWAKYADRLGPPPAGWLVHGPAPGVSLSWWNEAFLAVGFAEAIAEQLNRPSTLLACMRGEG